MLFVKSAIICLVPSSRKCIRCCLAFSCVLPTGARAGGRGKVTCDCVNIEGLSSLFVSVILPRGEAGGDMMRIFSNRDNSGGVEGKARGQRSTLVCAARTRVDIRRRYTWEMHVLYNMPHQFKWRMGVIHVGNCVSRLPTCLSLVHATFPNESACFRSTL